MATQAEIVIWAKGIGLSTCIGTEFNAQFGRLPNTLPELVNWGNSTGRRNQADGTWSCKGTGGGGGDGGGGGTSDIIQQITDFIKENPLLVGGALVVLLLLKRK